MIDIDKNVQNKCACKGIRKCALCFPYAKNNLDDILSNKTIYIYCQKCQKASILNDKYLHDIKLFLQDSYQIENIECFCSKKDTETEIESININGIFLKLNFINYEEENYLINEINNFDWNESQSGQLFFEISFISFYFLFISNF
jgi:hypothetical protein